MFSDYIVDPILDNNSRLKATIRKLRREIKDLKKDKELLSKTVFELQKEKK